MVARKRAALACLSLVALAVAAYAPVRDNDFILWDDESHIRDNPVVADRLGPATVFRAFEFNEITYWQPVTVLSFAVDRAVFGLDPRAFHYENVAWHAAAAVILFALLAAATGVTGRSFVVAALFVVHPVNVEAVAWAVERRTVLAAFFGFGSMLAYVQAVRHRRVALYAIAVLCGMLSLSAKGLLLTLPLLLLLLDLWPLGRTDVPVRRLIAEKVPALVLCGLGAGVIHASLPPSQPVQAPLSLRLANACVAPLRQLVHVLWPSGLSPWYELPPSVPPWQVVASAATIAALFGGAWRMRRRAPYLLFGLAWFLIALIPTLGLVQGGRWPAFADRHAYVAMVGILIAVVWGAADLLSRRTAAAMALTGGAVATLVFCTARQVTVWRNSVTVSARALETAPTTAFVHYALGTALLRESPPDMAGGVDHLTTAVRLDPDDRFAMTNLGIALGQAGMPESGLDYIARVLRRSPNDARARIAMGRLLLDVGRPDEAIGWLRGGLELVPADREAYVNLGVALNRVRRFDDTIAYITQSSAAQRQIPEVRFNLGVAYASTGRTSEALAEVGALRSIAPELAASLAAFVDSARFGEPSPR